MRVIKEVAFEDAVVDVLVSSGRYARGIPTNYEPALALDAAELMVFIGATQAEAWEDLVRRYGGDADLAQKRFYERLKRQIDDRGTIDVLRHGVEDLGVHIRLAYFRPASGLNPDLEARYDANRLTVIRQLHYAPEHANALDLVLFVNGLPVATAELKNPLTHQSVEHAMAQYRSDRDPRDALLGKRAIVHFAVDPGLVMMTTKLEGQATRFLPFNRGSASGETACGAGNPANPDGYATSYLWETVWARDAWLDILNRFVHLQRSKPGTKGKAGTRGASMIFPRFHQWDAVRRLEDAAREHGAGRNYLIQHSAGSGKSNTIAWLAHRLASLHDASDAKVFDKVVVVTDRKVLDRQLQDTVSQFEHAHGVVRRIEESSRELADALRSSEAKIIVTTLQKFPFVVEEVAALPESRYAVVVDEAHSSQTGETAHEMKRALAGLRAEVPEGEEGEIDAADAVEAAVEASARARGRHENLSMFAFTATPKAKALELFGEPPDQDGRHQPFHLYSMRQAIDEGFIMDVLRQYTTYDTYFRLARAGEEDPDVAAREASKAIARYVTLHPSVMAQKAAIVVEHFRRSTRDRIGGEAKAMVVCRSRLSAVRFKLAIDAHAREHGYGDVPALVAFSGTVSDGGVDYTEPNMNGFPESQTAQRFATDEYRILVVAEKFQTGFDQPLLHTMFVDKQLLGVNAVQTLSRLNRINPAKEDTFVLDFVNDAEQIQRSFAPYYDTSMAAPTDPNELYDAWRELDRFGVIRAEDVEAFAREYFGEGSQARMYALLDAARDRFIDLDDTDQEECRTRVKRFVSRYAFLSQVLPMADTIMEKRFAYTRLLERRLPAEATGSMDVGDQVEMTHLRVKKTGEHDISLERGGTVLQAFGPGGPGAYEDLMEPLSELIERLNERFGIDLSEADRLHLEGIVADLAADPEMQERAAANTEENFRLEFEDWFRKAVASRLHLAEELTYRILDDKEFSTQLQDGLSPRAYERARVAYQKTCPIGELLARDEDKHLEFKSSLRWDRKAEEKSKLVEAATIKTVAAFLNSAFGGTLLIGVDDGGAVVGLEADYATLRKPGKGDSDLFLLHLNQLIENAVGLAAATNVTTTIHQVDGQDLCRVHVEPSGHPVEADFVAVDDQGQFSKQKVFFVRLNNGTRAIRDERERERYKAQRWGPPTSA
jgi:type I restriction enzyme R subunit